MTPQELLKDIESKNYEWSSEDVMCLIARCKQLEESLGIIASDFATNYGDSIIAIEALNTMPEGDK